MKLSKTKVVALALAVCLIAVLSMGSLAWFTDEDSVTNDFFIAGSEDENPDDVFSVDVWEKDAPNSGDKIQDGIDYPNILPGDDLYKEVNIENTGAYEQYVRAIVTVSDASIWQQLHGTLYVPLEKIATDLNENFETWNIAFDEIADTLTYVLYFNDKLPATGADTVTLFTNIEIPEAMDRNQAAEMAGGFVINVVAQAVQTKNVGDTAPEAFETVGMGIEKGNNSLLGVTTAAALQKALDEATTDTEIVLQANITGDVTVTQKANVNITIAGESKTFAGVITVDGKSATILTAGLTVKDVVFKANTISADACIRLGNGTNATRYVCNLTVDGCTFDVPGAVGVKSYTGGDKNVVIKNCTANAGAHSLAQLKGVDGVLVEKCIVNSVRGINFNNSQNITVNECTIDVEKYAVRFGEGNNDIVENFAVTNCTLASLNVEGDAAIVLRAGATNANLDLTGTTITAGVQMAGHENANITK